MKAHVNELNRVATQWRKNKIYRFYLTRDGKRMMGSDDIDDIRDMINDLRNVDKGN